MEAFKHTLDYCNLIELESRGPVFTWCNGRDGQNFIRECLDRVVANKEWCDAHPNAEISIEEATASDHSPIHIVLLGRATERRSGGFGFEASWAEEEGCKKIIKQVWHEKLASRGCWQNVEKKMEKSKKELMCWHKVTKRQNGSLIQ